MMVVHEDSENPVEIPVIRKPRLEKKSYVIVENHVRELINIDESSSSRITADTDAPPHKSDIKENKLKRKSDKKLNKGEKTSINTSEKTKSEFKIDENDLEQLRSVYNKCKEVISKIENKYGHLLNLNIEESGFRHKKRKLNTDSSSESDCHCKPNKKIVFDDDGKQSTVEMSEEKHICVHKTRQPYIVPIVNQNISIEYGEQDTNLPDNLTELGNMLHDPEIDKISRNNILQKIRILKQEYANEIRFNKHALIEKLKCNPEEVLDFKGTNLSTIPGYS